MLHALGGFCREKLMHVLDKMDRWGRGSATLLELKIVYETKFWKIQNQQIKVPLLTVCNKAGEFVLEIKANFG